MNGGSGYGSGSGNGNGYGDGDGYGYGYGSGSGNGNGDGYGSGNGNGDGYGSGSGNGNGNGYGNGYGDGDGYGSGLETREGVLTEYFRAIADVPGVAQWALQLENAEARRLLVEMIGPQIFLVSSCIVVHEDRDRWGQPRKLVRLPLNGTTQGYIQAVIVIDPAQVRLGKEGVTPIYVSSQPHTCAEAVAETFSLTPSGEIVLGQVRHGDVLLTPVERLGDVPDRYAPEREL